MFEVRHEDDAWDLGVLFTAGHVRGSTAELGVPVELVEFFAMGQHDHAALSESRVEQLACQWDVLD